VRVEDTTKIMREQTRTSIVVGVLALAGAVAVSSIIWASWDVEYKWLAAKAWAAGQFPAFEPNHHNLRWGVNIPAAVWVAIFGSSPLSYLLLNYVVFAAASALLYALARTLTSPGGATLILAFWLINPIAYYLSANLMPEVYSVAYLLMGLLFLQLAYARNSPRLYVFAVLGFFALYGAKETNAFFLPGLALYELIKQRLVNLALLVGVFAVCLGVETVVINVLFTDRNLLLGRAQLLAHGNAVTQMQTIFVGYTPADILRRWWFKSTWWLERQEVPGINYPAKLVYLLFGCVSAFLVARAWWLRKCALPELEPAAAAKLDALYAIVAMGLSFAFLTTFFILDINPLILGQTLVDRYLWVLLPPALIVLVWTGERALGSDSARIGASSSIVQGLRQAAAWLQLWCGRMPIVAAGVVTAIALLAHYHLERQIVRERRDGLEQPYNIFTVNSYYRDSIRNPLERGCTVVFAARLAAWSSLAFAFPHGYFSAPEDLYHRRFDRLTTSLGARVQAWDLDLKQAPELRERLYMRPGALERGVVEFDPLVVRFAGAQLRCEEVRYVGFADIPRQAQVLEGVRLTPPE
jgi:cell division protein FtsL